ncbi:MAG: glycosyltransferase [Candidatus Cloacimonadales bacterium]
MKKMMNCSIGVIVYNEEANIGKLLTALQKQKLQRVKIAEIIVVSSACSDRTDEIVSRFAQKDQRISLISEVERRGKSAAINRFIEAASSEFLIIESGDTIPAADTVEKLILAFEDETIGMSGGRPLPENPESNFVGYSVNLLWRLHHQMALISPKLGEMVAFRNIVQSIPPESAVDEASLEAVIRAAGYSKKYIPSALIYNKGPENIKEFIMQRRRIAAGHLWLIDHDNYRVASQNKQILLGLTRAEFRRAPHQLFWLLGAICLEAYSRWLGWIDYKFKNKNPYKWEIATSTKNLRDK